MANSKKVSQESKKSIVLALGAVLSIMLIIAVVAAINTNSSDRGNKSEPNTDLSTTYREAALDTAESTPDTSSPTYFYDLIEEGMSEKEVDSTLGDYEKNVSTEITFDGEHSKTVTYTGDLPNDSFMVITVRFTDGVVSYKTNYTGENPKTTPYDSINTGMSESEVDDLLSGHHKYEESSSSYGGQTSKVVRYTDSGSTFIITYINSVVSGKAR